jgi:signal transduction histidine kinase
MSDQHCSVEQLAEVFRDYRKEIIDEWLLRAGELLRELKLDRAALTDHVPDIVDEIISDLTLQGDRTAPAVKNPGSEPRHGMQRVSDGLDVGEVVAEYNLLRAAFFTVAERHDMHLVGETARIVNDRIDDGVRSSVMAFAAQQTVTLKKYEDEHLAFIAHDLRTPLNAVSLLIEELQEVVGSKVPGTGEIFEILSRNLRRIESLIKRVLDARVQRSGTGNPFQPECRFFELWPVVHRLIFDLRAVSAKHSIKVLNEIPRALTVFGDAILIAQVYQNLLGNAFKYARRGQVTLTAREEAGSVTCTVQDNGAGIPPELLVKVFDKLATDPEQPGTGLGLAIVKQIVEAHNGVVSAESVPGDGAMFTFTLPTPPAEAG